MHQTVKDLTRGEPPTLPTPLGAGKYANKTIFSRNPVQYCSHT